MNEMRSTARCIFQTQSVAYQNRPFNLYKLLANIIKIKLLKFWWNFEFH